MERREALITGVVLAVTCALITVIVSTRTGPGSTIALTDDSAVVADPDERSDPADLDDLALPSELQEFVADAIAFVEATRGRSFPETPDVRVLDERDFVDRIDADFAEDFDADPAAVEMYNAFYRSTGMISPDESIDEVIRQYGAAGILGFYDPETDELVVRQVDELTLLTKSTIVHELTHAYDDQLFDLDRPEYDERTDEIAWTLRALAEGSASWVESAWESGLTPGERSALLNEELGFGDPSAFDAFELSFLLYEISFYEHGEPFVDHLVESGGTAALDAAFLELPETSEQVINPGAYDDDELPLQIDPPVAEADPLFEGAGGQALIESLFLGAGVFVDVKWGGDQMSVWADADQSCVRWDVQADTPDGLADLRDGFEQWGSRVGGTTVTNVDSATIRVQRCA